jgi:methylenetetrahydrofolate reductase (NADPH)
LDGISGLDVDYISVTYGAGGSTPLKRTTEIAGAIQDKYNTPAMAHLTCVNMTFAEAKKVLDELDEIGVHNVLALRGDIPAGADIVFKDFHYGSDLAAFIRKEKPHFCVCGACYPECHYQAASIDADIENLKKKIDAGAEFLITQLFLDNDVFYRFLEKLDKAGVTVPVAAGIMPVTKQSQLKNMIELSGAKVPPQLTEIVNGDGLPLTGLEYAAKQIRDLRSHGVRHIHLYTMNNAENARTIVSLI